MIGLAITGGEDGDIALATFKFTGSFDDVCAQLNASFEAREAQFNANLEALLRSPAPQLTSAGPTAKPHASAGWTRDMNSNRVSSRNNDASLRGRRRTSHRFTPSR